MWSLFLISFLPCSSSTAFFFSCCLCFGLFCLFCLVRFSPSFGTSDFICGIRCLSPCAYLKTFNSVMWVTECDVNFLFLLFYFYYFWGVYGFISEYVVVYTSCFFLLTVYCVVVNFFPLLFPHFMVDRMVFSVMRWCSVSVIDEVGCGGKRKSRTSGDLSLSLISADFLISSFLFFHCHVFEEHPSLLICLGLRSWATSRPSVTPSHCPAQHLQSIWWTLCPGTVLTIFMLSVELSGGYSCFVLFLCDLSPLFCCPALHTHKVYSVSERSLGFRLYFMAHR